MQKLRATPFSLNMDEATNNANDKILNILVQYFDKVHERVIFEHLASRKQPISSAEEIFSTLEAIMTDNKLPWSNVVSVLLDNCSVMRGCKAGVEARIRTATGGHLLDVSGDTVHMLQNAAKAFTGPFGQYVEGLCGDIYYDIDESPRARSLFFEVQNIVGPTKSALRVLRPIGSRFLQMIQVCDRIHALWDSLLIYYHGYLTDEERQQKRYIYIMFCISQWLNSKVTWPHC